MKKIYLIVFAVLAYTIPSFSQQSNDLLQGEQVKRCATAELLQNFQRANPNATTGISTIFSVVIAATSAARPPRPGNGAPRRDIPNAINAPGTANPAINPNGALIGSGIEVPVAASRMPRNDARTTGFRTGWINTRRHDGRWPVSIKSRNTNAIGASTSS